MTWDTGIPLGEGQTARFRAPLGDTYSLFLDEVGRLRAEEVFLRVGLPDGGILRLLRNGLPPVRMRMTHRGVDAMIFGERPLFFKSVKWAGWQDNLRAIALTLQSLRAVDRYGCNDRGQQYEGWAAELPPKPTVPPGDAALRVLAERAGVAHDPNLPVDEIPALYRKAVRGAHPDIGGSTAATDAVQRARRTLESLGRWPGHEKASTR